MGRPKIIGWGTVALVFLLSAGTFVYAQSRVPEKFLACQRECVERFRADPLDFNDPLVKKFQFLLDSYIDCVSMFDTNIIKEAQKAGLPIDSSSYIFLAKLADPKYSVAALTGRYMKEGMKALSMDQQEYTAFVQGFRSGDTSVCKGDPECIGLIKLDPQPFSQDGEKDSVYFMRAVKHSNPQACRHILNEDKRVLCEAVAASDAGQCKQIREFKSFKELYCSAKCE